MVYKKNRGFTLIELLVVIAIIGILSSVVLASLNTARQKSRDAKRISDVKQLQLALELYFDTNGGYPSTIGTSTSSPLITGNFMSVIPVDPTTDASYLYAALNADCTSYHIGATLEGTSNQVLSSDVDAVAGTAGTNCPDGGASSASDFAGTDPIYDAKP